MHPRMKVIRARERADIRALPSLLGIDMSKQEIPLHLLPFNPEDLTIGTESEYQTAVLGDRNHADLPRTIEESAYFANISRRVKAGDVARRSVLRLEEFLRGNTDRVWENSWLRFPMSMLKPSTREVFFRDLKEDKTAGADACRIDMERFFLEQKGERWIRVPSSYVLKLAIVDMLSDTNSAQWCDVEALSGCFLNDNSSPETLSFFPSEKVGGVSAARGAAEENAFRFLLSQLAVMYANRAFGLEENGQKLLLYFSPTTPLRIRRLNDLVSDSFYRELFMSPCLSGWDRGYDKHEYMHLCHQVLSRSHLNSVIKLKDAGILTQPLVRLDSISNTSLANNGTHVSIGSRMLGRLASENHYTAALEKSAGDLVIKIFEHFLPLFPGLFGASPWRVSYYDFRAENLVGFLAHELDFTHLRMFWRRWVKKAGLDVMGHSVLPYGPDWYEFCWKEVFRLKGDYVPDIRLIDYLAALMSTPESPALDGCLGNDFFLKRDLSHLGVFDEKMSLYLPYKLRAFSTMGFCGFEGRFYSTFHSFDPDLSDACALQSLITAWAWKNVLSGRLTHAHIPDEPETESERRQIFFAAAVGLSAVSIRQKNPAAFMTAITSLATTMRRSRRYQGQYRLRVREYRLALVSMLRSDAELVEAYDAAGMLDRVEDRICGGASAAEKLTREIIGNDSKRPIHIHAEEFNAKTEAYYRNELRRQNIRESMHLFESALERSLDRYSRRELELTAASAGCMSPVGTIRDRIPQTVSDALTVPEIRSLAEMLAIYLHHQCQRATPSAEMEKKDASSPVYRSADFRDHG